MVTALTHSTEVQALELDRVAFEVVQRPVRSARHEERKESLTGPHRPHAASRQLDPEVRRERWPTLLASTPRRSGSAGTLEAVRLDPPAAALADSLQGARAVVGVVRVPRDSLDLQGRLVAAAVRHRQLLEGDRPQGSQARTEAVDAVAERCPHAKTGEVPGGVGVATRGELVERADRRLGRGARAGRPVTRSGWRR